MSSGGHDLDGGEADGAHAAGQPLGGGGGVALVLALGADAGDAQQLVQLLDAPLAAALQVFGDGHPAPCFGEGFARARPPFSRRRGEEGEYNRRTRGRYPAGTSGGRADAKGG